MTPVEKLHYERTSRLKLLFQNWTSTRQKIDEAHYQAATVGSTAGIKPSLIRKLTNWMAQIGTLERKEKDIISEIDAIEKKHKQLRKERKLHRAKPAPDRSQEISAPEPDQRRKRNPWLVLLFFLALTHKNKKS